MRRAGVAAATAKGAKAGRISARCSPSRLPAARGTWILFLKTPLTRMTVNRLEHRQCRAPNACNHITRTRECGSARPGRNAHNGECFCSALTAAIVTLLFVSCAGGTAGKSRRVTSTAGFPESKPNLRAPRARALRRVGPAVAAALVRTYVCIRSRCYRQRRCARGRERQGSPYFFPRARVNQSGTIYRPPRADASRRDASSCIVRVVQQ